MGGGAAGKTRSRLGRRAFTLIELLVVIGSTSLVSGLLFPVLIRVRDEARQANRKQAANAATTSLRR